MSLKDNSIKEDNSNSYGQYSGRQNIYYGPGGRLLMVENAIEGVGKGSTTIGIRTEEFALLLSHIKPTLPLVDPSEKIFSIDYHIGATGSGYIGDMLKIIDELRLLAQRHRIALDGPIDINTISRQIASYFHGFTMYSVRPQAVSLIVTGVDSSGIKLFQIDPSGTCIKGSGFAIGYYSEVALNYMQKGYQKNITLEKAIQLGSESIEKAIGETPLLEGGIITLKEKIFKKIDLNDFSNK